jgi:hypothetical protein
MAAEQEQAADDLAGQDGSSGRPEQPESSRLHELRVRRGSPATGTRDAFVILIGQLQQRVLAEWGATLDLSDPAQARAAIQEKLELILADEKLILTRNEKRQVVETILQELRGSNHSNSNPL